MPRSSLWITVLSIIAVFVVVSVSLSGTPGMAQADIQPQTPTPWPSPTNNGGSAQWTVAPHTFTSDYPHGGAFSVTASSSAGKITSALLLYYHNPSSRKRLSGTYDEASGTWRAVWDTGGFPPWVGVWHWWQLIDEAGNVYVTPIQEDEYADTFHKWNRLDSDDILVFWESTLPANTGEQTVAAMQAARVLYFEAWGTLLRYKPRAIIFDIRYPAAYDAWGNVEQARRLAGFVNSGYGAFVGIMRPNRENARSYAERVVLHEVAHLYQNQNGGMFDDVWFIEGNAELFVTGKAERERMLGVARRYARAGSLPPLSQLGRQGRVGYDVGFAFWLWFTEKFGIDAHREVWQRIGRGSPGLRAFEQVTGRTFVDLETEFRDWLGAPNAVPPTVAPTETFVFFPSPTPYPTRTPKP